MYSEPCRACEPCTYGEIGICQRAITAEEKTVNKDFHNGSCILGEGDYAPIFRAGAEDYSTAVEILCGSRALTKAGFRSCPLTGKECFYRYAPFCEDCQRRI